MGLPASNAIRSTLLKAMNAPPRDRPWSPVFKKVGVCRVIERVTSIFAFQEDPRFGDP